MARLPFDHLRVDAHPFVYSERDWRSTPDIKVSRDISPYLDEIACLAANRVSRTAEESIFRTFHYNMMSRSDFRNNDFEKLVRFVCDYIEFRVAVGNIRRPEDRLEDSITTAVDLHCSKQINDFPELMREGEAEHSPRIVLGVRSNADKYLELIDEIDKLFNDDPRREEPRRDERRYSSRDDREERSRDFRSQYSGGDSRNDSRGRGDERRGGWDRGSERVLSGREVMERERHDPSRDVDMSNVAINRFVPQDQPQGRETSHHIQRCDAGSDSRLSTTERDIPRRAMTPSSEFIRDKREDPRETQYAAPVFNAPASREIQPTEPPPPPPVQYVAAPPAPAPRQMTYEEETQGIVAQHTLTKTTEDEDGDGILRSPFGEHKLLRRIRKNEVNIDQHAAVYGAGSELGEALFQEAKRLVSLEDAVKDPTVTAEQLKESVVVFEDLQIRDSIQDLAIAASEAAVSDIIQESGDNSDGVRKIHHSYGIVSNAIVGFSSLNDIQVPLNNATTLREILSLLKRTQKLVDENAPAVAAYGTDLRAVVSRFDRLITREINLFCREVIKVSPGNAISSAVAQFDDLVDAVQKTRPPEVTNAFLAFLSSLFASIKESLAPSLEIQKLSFDAAVAEEDQSIRGIALLPMVFHTTHIPFTLGELGITTDETVVLEANDISQFLKSALTATSEDHPEFSSPNRLLVTRDLGVFRVFNFPGRANAMVLVPVQM